MVNSLGYVECPPPTQTPDLTVCSADGRFRVQVGHHELEALLDMCRESGDLETGGVLVGRYNEAHDTAIVTRVWGPPEDSVRRRTSFWRGTQGCKSNLTPCGSPGNTTSVSGTIIPEAPVNPAMGTNGRWSGLPNRLTTTLRSPC